MERDCAVRRAQLCAGRDLGNGVGVGVWRVGAALVRRLVRRTGRHGLGGAGIAAGVGVRRVGVRNLAQAAAGGMGH